MTQFTHWKNDHWKTYGSKENSVPEERRKKNHYFSTFLLMISFYLRSNLRFATMAITLSTLLITLSTLLSQIINDL